MPNQSEFILQPYTRTDAPQVVEVINANAAQTLGFNQAVVDEVGNVRLARYVSPTSKKAIVINARNEVVGFGYCVNDEQYIVSAVGGAVHPQY